MANDGSMMELMYGDNPEEMMMQDEGEMYEGEDFELNPNHLEGIAGMRVHDPMSMYENYPMNASDNYSDNSEDLEQENMSDQDYM